MIRETSLEAYQTIKDNGLLSKRRQEIYEIVVKHGPGTANELFQRSKVFNHSVQANFHARLGELRAEGVVNELKERICSVTGKSAYEWSYNGRLPVKWDKPKKIKCKACNGKGHIIEQQAKLF